MIESGARKDAVRLMDKRRKKKNRKKKDKKRNKEKSVKDACVKRKKKKYIYKYNAPVCSLFVKEQTCTQTHNIQRHTQSHNTYYVNS